MDLLKQSTHPRTQEFLECILDHNLLPTITKPTRITNSSATLIDNILISRKFQADFESVIIKDDLSDHLPCLVNLKDFKQNMCDSYITKRILNRKAIEKIKTDLSQADWNHILFNKPANEPFHSFHTELMLALNKYAPDKLLKKRLTENKTPWMTKGLKTSIRKSKKLYEKALKDPIQLQKYRDYMTSLRKCKRKLKLSYYQSKCIKFKKKWKKNVGNDK